MQTEIDMDYFDRPQESTKSILECSRVEICIPPVAQSRQKELETENM